MADSLLDQARAASWYHTIDLGSGVVTPGWFDLRPYVHHYGLPEQLTGLRALDVGTWDGYWAFEMERRGAEVVALDVDDERDLDWPPRRRPAEFPAEPRGRSFRLAHEILGSRVERVNLSIYNATPEELGTFDVVFCGSVLLHLRDQMLALERIAGLTGGLFISAEEYDRITGLLPVPASRYLADRDNAVVFWLPARRTWARMLSSAGFNEVREHTRFVLRDRAHSFAVRHVVHHARQSEAAMTTRPSPD